MIHSPLYILFFFNDPPTTEIYTLSLHDALPIRPSSPATPRRPSGCRSTTCTRSSTVHSDREGRRLRRPRSEEHTSELQSRRDVVCRLLLEKKNNLAVLYVC